METCLVRRCWIFPLICKARSAVSKEFYKLYTRTAPKKNQGVVVAGGYCHIKHTNNGFNKQGLVAAWWIQPCEINTITASAKKTRWLQTDLAIWNIYNISINNIGVVAAGGYNHSIDLTIFETYIQIKKSVVDRPVWRIVTWCRSPSNTFTYHFL